MQRILLFLVASSLTFACRHVDALAPDGGSTDADTDSDSDSDSDTDTDTDPFDDYDCETPYSSICEAAVCTTQDQFQSTAELCTEGDDFACQVLEECYPPYWVCIDEACEETQNPDPETVLDCLEDLQDCMIGLVP